MAKPYMGHTFKVWAILFPYFSHTFSEFRVWVWGQFAILWPIYGDPYYGFLTLVTSTIKAISYITTSGMIMTFLKSFRTFVLIKAEIAFSVFSDGIEDCILEISIVTESTKSSWKISQVILSTEQL